MSQYIQKTITSLLGLILLGGLVACSNMPIPLDGTNTNLDKLLIGSHERGLFNGNVLITKQGKIVYQNSLGFIDGSKTVRLTPQTVFNTGSIAKEFNAVGIMLLIERGQLSLDDTLAQYFPSLPIWAEQIQIKHLLNYTSGLPAVNWNSIKNPEDAFADIMKVKSLPFVPGEGYIYSNNNVLLQRLIITKVSGQSFTDFTFENLLKPSGMSQAIIDPGLNTPELAVAFNNNYFNDSSIVIPIHGWVHLTTQDMQKWLTALHSGKLISDASLKTLFKSHSKNELGALGLGKYENNTLSYHQHHGSSRNFEALVSYDLSQDLMSILFTNKKDRKLFKIAKEIDNIFAGENFSIPKKPVAPALEKYCTQSLELCINSYKDLKEKNYASFDFESGSFLNRLGYSLLRQGRTQDAIEIFKFLVSELPEAANPYDSLGEAYLTDQNYVEALKNYQKSLLLNPSNDNAKTMIRKIKEQL